MGWFSSRRHAPEAKPESDDLKALTTKIDAHLARLLAAERDQEAALAQRAELLKGHAQCKR